MMMKKDEDKTKHVSITRGVYNKRAEILTKYMGHSATSIKPTKKTLNVPPVNCRTNVADLAAYLFSTVPTLYVQLECNNGICSNMESAEPVPQVSVQELIKPNFAQNFTDYFKLQISNCSACKSIPKSTFLVGK